MADRFRAYTTGQASASQWAFENGERIRSRSEWDVEDVAFEGDITAGKAKFDAGDALITKVVFYTGDAENETVVGSVDVNASGKISVEAPAQE